MCTWPFIESEPPVADAGPDVNIKLPQDFVTLDGGGSTDDVGVVRYQWEQTRGKDANMLGKDNALFNLYGLDVGQYTFTLTVYDADGQSDQDDVIVEVKGTQRYRISKMRFLRILLLKKLHHNGTRFSMFICITYI